MTTSPETEHPTGPFTIGVGGVVIEGGKVLLVKLTYAHKGWILPGGYVKSTETIGKAIIREVHEDSMLNLQSRCVCEVGLSKADATSTWLS